MRDVERRGGGGGGDRPSPIARRKSENQFMVGCSSKTRP